MYLCEKFPLLAFAFDHFLGQNKTSKWSFADKTLGFVAFSSSIM